MKSLETSASCGVDHVCSETQLCVTWNANVFPARYKIQLHQKIIFKCHIIVQILLELHAINYHILYLCCNLCKLL